MSTSPQQDTDTSPSSQNAKSANKRRRVALACSSCRERKVRCDGSIPICGSCRARGASSYKCEYLAIAETAKNQTERAYVQYLQQHIIDLERSTVSLSTEQEESQDRIRRNVMNSGPSNERQSLSGLHPANASMAADDVQKILDLPASTSPMGENIGFHANSVNAMGAAITDLNNPGIGDQFYGEPSIVSLLQRSSHSVPPRSPSQRQGSVQRPTKSTSSSCSWSTPSTLLGTSSGYLDDFSLPPRKIADSLLEIYFNSVHVLYPWVHRETFLTSYEALWSSLDPDDIQDLPDVGVGGLDCSAIILHCSLNAMFALGSEFSHMAPEEKRAFSYLFFSRMKNLVNIDVLDSGSLAHVQALLLVGMYLQCTRDPKRCWNVIGMAYRMSVGLGLHLSKSMPGLTRLEREMRWRIWCACVQMDIIISMTMGRPAMTSPSQDIPLPSPLSDSCLANSDSKNSQPRGTNSTNQFLFENMRLIALLERILSNVYHSSSAKSQITSPGAASQEVQAIMDIESALEKYELDVHPDLHWVTSTQGPELNTNSTLKRQTNILHARFLHLRLLLYRPAFSDFCASSKSNTSRSAQARDPRALENSWSRLFTANCAKKCIRSACDLIESLWRATSQDATGAWWYGVFYLVSAGIILILAEMSEISFDEPERSQRAVAWVRCTDTLQRMIDVHPCARDYKIALEGLRGRHAPHEAGGTDEQHGRNGPGEAHDALSPLFWNWESGLEDIMLPAQLLQSADEELFLPALF